jgi:inosine-uridine nucleoside N-ribohydrolase
MIDIILDMETADLDDILMLLFSLHNSLINLLGVTVTPGSKEQINLIGHLLELCGRPDIQIGSFNINHPKNCVSGMYYKLFGEIPAYTKHIHVGWQLIRDINKPGATIVTGAPLKNLGELIINVPDIKIDRWVCQGGYVSDNMIPEEYPKLEKFKGLDWCNTYNFNGAPKYALLLIESENIKQKYFVSKNICHQMEYTKDKLVKDNNNDIIKNILSVYLEKKDSKKLHDLVALITAIEPDIITWIDGTFVRGEKGQWGSIKGNDKLAGKIDEDKFWSIFMNRNSF